MASLVGLKEPERWIWHVASVFSLALAYALVCGGQLMLGAMAGLGMTARYMLLAMTAIVAGLFSGLLLSAQCSSHLQMFVATRNISFFPACFVSWLMIIIIGMQSAAAAFAAENVLSFADPFGPMTDPLASGLIVLLVYDAAVMPFLISMSGEKVSVFKYEALVILMFVSFYLLLNAAL